MESADTADTLPKSVEVKNLQPTVEQRDISHMLNQCEATESKCINCKGAHDAMSKNCPNDLCEKEIYSIEVDQNISFKEERQKVMTLKSTNTTRYSQDFTQHKRKKN